MRCLDLNRCVLYAEEDRSIVYLAALHGANGELGFVRCDREAAFVPVELEADCEEVLAWVRHRDLGKALDAQNVQRNVVHDGLRYCRARQSVVTGQSVTVLVDLGGRSIIKKKK